MSRKFSLAYLTIPGTNPMDQIRIAKEAGYDYVSLRTIPMYLKGEPEFIMEQDPELFKATKQALKDYDMKLMDIELARVREDLDNNFDAAFEKGAELGATDVLSSIWAKDHAFNVDGCGKICEKAAKFGLTVNLEFVTFAGGVTNLKEALAIVTEVKAPNLKIMVDTVHAHRSRVTPAELAAAPAEMYGFIHLCDCPGPIPALDDPEMIRVAREARNYCGEGGADIAGMLKALPANPCSIELPNAEMVNAYGKEGHAKRCLETAKAYFAAHGLD